MAAKTPLQASDPRDFVYALLSLVDPGTGPVIKVDYHKDWPTVRLEIAKACLVYRGPRFP